LEACGGDAYLCNLVFFKHCDLCLKWGLMAWVLLGRHWPQAATRVGPHNMGLSQLSGPKPV
jgi:hypothetical protein